MEGGVLEHNLSNNREVTYTNSPTNIRFVRIVVKETDATISAQVFAVDTIKRLSERSDGQFALKVENTIYYITSDQAEHLLAMIGVKCVPGGPEAYEF